MQPGHAPVEPPMMIDLCVISDTEGEWSALPSTGKGVGSGASGDVEMADGSSKDADDAKCKPCAFILAMPFMLIGIILFPFGLLFKLLKCICCCAPGGCCMSCIFGAAETLTQIPCKIYDCFKSCIPC
eukprot:TRINITY_DN2037_c0_g1_i1.p1 TRINITY_DN2037_c0_g1~~TRINITY_DN2037_c0_g1_i1.p1  ORF type:complete len:128 (+),score=8.43 TRINITY_DN2037_c0_g1_i1:211-594(+)